MVSSAADRAGRGGAGRSEHDGAVHRYCWAIVKLWWSQRALCRTRHDPMVAIDAHTRKSCVCLARIDLGTADELSLDVLLNTLVGFSAQMCALKAITLGGANEDWPLPEGWEGDASGLGPDDEFMRVRRAGGGGDGGGGREMERQWT